MVTNSSATSGNEVKASLPATERLYWEGHAEECVSRGRIEESKYTHAFAVDDSCAEAAKQRR